MSNSELAGGLSDVVGDGPVESGGSIGRDGLGSVSRGELPPEEGAGLSEDGRGEEGASEQPESRESGQYSVSDDYEVQTEYEVSSEYEIAIEEVAGSDLEGGEESSAAEQEDFEPLPVDTPEQMTQLEFVDVVLVLPSTHPVVVLQEVDPPYRELRIPVGGAEGVAIGYAARRVETPRPLTHELMSRVLDAFNLTVDTVRLSGARGANFLAEMVLSGPTGVRTVDCRPSDAIALVLRRELPVPIMVAPDLLEEMGGPAAGSN